MTLFELFPWLLATLVALISVISLRKLGVPGFAACSIGLTLGISVWLIHVFFRNKVLPWLQLKKLEREQLAVKSRKYQRFDVAKDYPQGKSLFYECAVCGNVVPSTPGQGAACKCQNVVVKTNLGRIEIREGEKVKVFTT